MKKSGPRESAVRAGQLRDEGERPKKSGVSGPGNSFGKQFPLWNALYTIEICYFKIFFYIFSVHTSNFLSTFTSFSDYYKSSI